MTSINASSGRQLWEMAETILNNAPGSKDNRGLPLLRNELAALDEKEKIAIALVRQQGKNGGLPPQEIEKIIQEITRKTDDKRKSLTEGIKNFIKLDTSNTQSNAEARQMRLEQQFKFIENPNVSAALGVWG